MNKAYLYGRLGAEPAFKQTAKGTSVAELRLATDSSYRDRAGAMIEVTDWHSVVVFGKDAENCKAVLHKGSKVSIVGRISTRSWEGKDGKKQYKTEIIAENIIFSASTLDEANEMGKQLTNAVANAMPQNKGDDDLPF